MSRYVNLSSKKAQPGQVIVLLTDGIVAVSGRGPECQVHTPSGEHTVFHTPDDVVKAAGLGDELEDLSAVNRTFVRVSAITGITGGPSSCRLHFIASSCAIAYPAGAMVDRLRIDPDLIEVNPEEDRPKPLAPSTPPASIINTGQQPVAAVSGGNVTSSPAQGTSPKEDDEPEADPEQAKKDEVNVKRRAKRAADKKTQQADEADAGVQEEIDDEEDDEPPAE